MQLKKLFKDDDAVSPVIGVILMVAITVILAAVIASFVLGLGDTADEVQPNTNFALDDVSVESDESVLTVTLTDGDTIDFEELVLRGPALEDFDTTQEDNGWANDLDGTWNTGQSVTITEGEDTPGLEWDDDNNEEDVTLNLVWEESGGDNSATLASFDFELNTDTP